MSNESDPHKEYNELAKTLETLAKRESELVQKLSQADPEKDFDAKVRWVDELKETTDATRKLKTTQRDLLKRFATP